MIKLQFKNFDKHLNGVNIVLLPFVVLLVYYTFFASDRFSSQSTFTIIDNSASTNGIDIGLLSVGGGDFKDERIIKEYLLSGDMLEFLDSEIALKSHYQNDTIDRFSKLKGAATKEEFKEYYQDHITVNFDEVSGLLSIEVQAFAPEYAVTILDKMLAKAEMVVNEISQQLAEEQGQFLERQIIIAQDVLKKKKQAFLLFQTKNQIYSPERQGELVSGIMSQLESQIIEENTNLTQHLSYQREDAPQVVEIRERIRALSEQIKSEREKLVGVQDGTLSSLMMEYINLELDLEFAKQSYAATLAALEQAKADASKKMKHLVVVSKPSLAEEAKYPNSAYVLTTFLMVLSMLFGIVRMMITTIREHRD